MEDSIKSIEDLKRANAAAQAAGGQVTNYNDWYNILENLEIAGVESTGSYSGDKLKLEQIKEEIQEYLEQQELERVNGADQQYQAKDTFASDKQQTVKANMANGLSSTLMADYMKYYHLLS